MIAPGGQRGWKPLLGNLRGPVSGQPQGRQGLNPGFSTRGLSGKEESLSGRWCLWPWGEGRSAEEAASSDSGRDACSLHYRAESNFKAVQNKTKQQNKTRVVGFEVHIPQL